MKKLFDPSPSLLNPVDLVLTFTKKKREELALPGRAIIVFDSGDLKRVLNNRKHRLLKAWASFRWLYEVEGSNTVITKSYFGGPNVAAIVEELSAFGVKEFVIWGYCGGIGEAVNIGDIIAARGALREDGVSYHYIDDSESNPPIPPLRLSRSDSVRGLSRSDSVRGLSRSDSVRGLSRSDSVRGLSRSDSVRGKGLNPPSPPFDKGGNWGGFLDYDFVYTDWFEEWEEEAKDRGFRDGLIWSCDAIYRETGDKIVKYGEMGISAVEMEVASFYAVCRYKGIKGIAFVVVSDLLKGEKWTPGFHTRPFREGVKRLEEFMLERVII